MNKLLEQLNNSQFSKDLCIDTLKNKRLECVATIGEKSKIEYIIFYQNVFLLKTEDFKKAIKEYENL